MKVKLINGKCDGFCSPYFKMQNLDNGMTKDRKIIVNNCCSLRKYLEENRHLPIHNRFFLTCDFAKQCLTKLSIQANIHRYMKRYFLSLS